MRLTERVYYRHVLAKEGLELSHYGLQGLLTSSPVTLYHGTTRTFTKFDMAKSRKDLVDQFYGSGIFLTPSKAVAWQYADANRNIGFDPEIISDLKRVNPNAGSFMESLFHHGKDAWDLLIEELKVKYPDMKIPGEDLDSAVEKHLKGVDPNTVADVSSYVIGSKEKPLGQSDFEELMDVFHGSAGRGTPAHIYKSLDELGLDSKLYRPKVYTVEVRAQNPLITKSKTQARAARKKGFDSVVYYGSDCVSGVPEVAVYNPNQVKIKSVEVGE